MAKAAPTKSISFLDELKEIGNQERPKKGVYYELNDSERTLVDDVVDAFIAKEFGTLTLGKLSSKLSEKLNKPFSRNVLARIIEIRSGVKAR